MLLICSLCFFKTELRFDFTAKIVSKICLAIALFFGVDPVPSKTEISRRLIEVDRN